MEITATKAAVVALPFVPLKTDSWQRAPAAHDLSHSLIRLGNKMHDPPAGPRWTALPRVGGASGRGASAWERQREGPGCHAAAQCEMWRCFTCGKLLSSPLTVRSFIFLS